jgi:magnesium-transporting ATPase (P-type)
MTDFNAAPKIFNPHEITIMPDRKFKKFSQELKDEIEKQLKQILSNSEYEDKLNENGLELVETINEETFFEFLEILTRYHSGQVFGSFLGSLCDIDSKYAHFFYTFNYYIKVETEELL